MNTLEKQLQTEFSINELNPITRGVIAEQVLTEAVKRKIPQQAMLSSLFNSDTGESHEHSSELMDLIKNEYQCNMVEVSSGNGQAQNLWNNETGEYDVYLSADCHESSEHSRNGLSDGLVDSYEGITDKNSSDIPAYEVIEIDGQPVRLDDMSVMVTITDSDYSLWDTIEDKGMLIVRHLSNWYGKGCQFKKDGYKKREALRLTKKHNRLMGYTVTTNEDGANGTVKKLAVKQLNQDKKGNRHLTNLAKQARRGQQWAIDSLTKIGYNEFA